MSKNYVCNDCDRVQYLPTTHGSELDGLCDYCAYVGQLWILVYDDEKITIDDVFCATDILHVSKMTAKEKKELQELMKIASKC